METVNCPCQGKYGRNWHRKRQLPPCDNVRRTRNAEWARGNMRRKERIAMEAWVPGTPILVPEIDPL